MENEILELTYSSSKFGEDLSIIHCWEEISTINIVTEDETLVGTANFNFYNTLDYENWLDVVFVADGDSDDDYFVLETLENNLDEDEILGYNIVLLKTIEIKPSYQYKGIGTMAMREFLNYWSYLGAEISTLEPAPLNSSLKGVKRKNCIEKLVSFYSKLDFEEIWDEKEQEPYLYKFLD